ncbi:dTDP-4-dehydrorhamnose reductase family protein [Candidatus Sulfurimonas baltica]|uniref:dTDP-4-dehydrorhamnose reductase n=1 Tax=Candidatus Sulfurimonas baltica TaxID=2740404 RepID=A0A7S7RNQ9_9BACT|nr:SDR family oxidoreductase [Candidatus Sulfurimonas baltica]QOY52693.1 SDR family oxidoreductase [Candidatus Sulfurimonas baltica]
MKKKVLILGSTGMLGHQVVNYFLQFEEYDVVDIAFRNKFREETIVLDVTNQNMLSKIIVDINSDFIINCIGVLIGGSNESISNAIYINSFLPHKLKDIAKTIEAKLIHISTDCVFSGKKGGYIEKDERDGQDTYAKTKALGEVIDNTNATLRTSIIGPELKTNGEGLFHWFMNQSGSINGFNKAIWSGVTTLELARVVKWAVENDITGLYHVTNNKSINKNELLNLFKKYTKKDIDIIAVDGKKVDKSFIDTRKEIDYAIPSYDEMVKDMVNLINNNKLYSQYVAG